MIRIRKSDLLETFTPRRIFNADGELYPFFNDGVFGNYNLISEYGYWKAIIFGEDFALTDGAGSFGRKLPESVVQIARKAKRRYPRMTVKQEEAVRRQIIQEIYKHLEKGN